MDTSMNAHYENMHIENLKSDILKLIEECISAKRVLRAPWEGPMADLQRRHLGSKRRLTDRFVLLARTRGRLHVTHRPRGVADGEEWNAEEWNTRVAERLLPDYARAAMTEEAEAAR